MTTWQGAEGVTRLRARVRFAVREFHGAPNDVLGAVERQVREHHELLLEGWRELKLVGVGADRFVNQYLVRATAIVNEVLRVLGNGAGDRWREQSDVAKGLVALLTEELKVYHVEGKR